MKYKDLVPGQILAIALHADKRRFIYCGHDMLICLWKKVDTEYVTDIGTMYTQAVFIVNESSFDDPDYIWHRLYPNGELSGRGSAIYQQYYETVIKVLFNWSEND